MRFSQAVDQFIADLQREGRINSRHTETAYRTKLQWLAEDVGNRDPRLVGKTDIKRWLARWPNVNSQAQAHAIANSFFDHARYEEWCTGNVARDVRPARRREPQVTRLTREETAHLLKVSESKRRDKWVAYLGCCAGLRSEEMRTLQGRNFARPGFILVVGKGQKERWVPIISDLEPIVQQILLQVNIDQYVLPGQRSAGHPTPEIMRDTDRGVSAAALYKQVVALGERADLAVRVTPHTLRRSFATYVARSAGIRVAKSLMGHADISTTQKYTDEPTLDELAVSLHGYSYFLPMQPQRAPEARS